MLSTFVPDRNLAKSIMDELDGALSNDGFEAAEALVVKAFEAHPGLPFVFKKLADVYSSIGDRRNAHECLNGIVPIDTLTRKFPEFVNRFPGFGESDKRVLVHESTRFEFPSDFQEKLKASTGKIESCIKSGNAFVDCCSDGAVWFDGFNRVLFNRDQLPVNGNSRGSATLVSGLARRHSPLHVNGRVFLLGNRGFNNFYHWMLDILPSFDLFDRAGFEFHASDRFVVFSCDSGFQKQSLQQLGVAPEQVVQLSKETPFISADEIVCPFFQNGMGMTMGAWVPEYLRGLWGVGHSDAETSSQLFNERERECERSRIWIARSGSARNGRSITNNDELESLLKRRRFEIVYPEKLSVSEQALMFSKADVVAGIHGAGLANIVHCKPGAKVLEIYGAHLAPCYLAISALTGLKYANLKCQPDSITSDNVQPKDKASLRTMDLTVDLSALEITLDQLINHADFRSYSGI